MSASDVVAFIYIIGPSNGPVKIGYSETPQMRLNTLQRQSNETYYILGTYPVGRRRALSVERYVHWLLRDKHIDNEWFDVTREEADEAIQRAFRQDIHPDYPMPRLNPHPTELSGGTYIRTKIAKGVIDRIHAASDGDHAAFFREAIENELVRRAL